jgi:hypothetical protein
VNYASKWQCWHLMKRDLRDRRLDFGFEPNLCLRFLMKQLEVIDYGINLRKEKGLKNKILTS